MKFMHLNGAIILIYYRIEVVILIDEGYDEVWTLEWGCEHTELKYKPMQSKYKEMRWRLKIMRSLVRP